MTITLYRLERVTYDLIEEQFVRLTAQWAIRDDGSREKRQGYHLWFESAQQAIEHQRRQLQETLEAAELTVRLTQNILGKFNERYPKSAAETVNE